MGFIEKPDFNYELVVNKNNELIDVKLNGESLKKDPKWMNAFKASSEFQAWNANKGNYGILTVSFHADDIKVVNENPQED